ncbi:MAG: NADH-quinone oxidoreductase subunit M, partial [bacterium]|nr:NADH-quinone oxidoreductase subunit M [bacterium]
MVFPLLTTMLFMPLAGAIILLFFSSQRAAAMRVCALVVMLLTFALSVLLFVLFDAAEPQMQFTERAAWIVTVGIDYHIGVDGISLPLVLLTTLLSPIALLQAWKSIDTKVREFAIFMLVLETGMIGVFLSLDLFLFFIFWEIILVPMYFLIGIWGGENRFYAMVKFILYTMTGSAIMLVAILTLHFLNNNPAYGTGQPSFSLFDMYNLSLQPSWQKLLFGAFFLAFAIKVPLFPFHTWLPDAHVEAPTAGSVILAGVLL